MAALASDGEDEVAILKRDLGSAHSALRLGEKDSSEFISCMILGYDL